MSAPDVARINTAILQAGSGDYLDLSYLTYLVEETLSSRDTEEIRAKLLEALRRLLSSGQLRAGYLEPPGEFVPWSLTPDQAYDRIETELQRLERPLQVGDIAWFEVPE